MLLPAFKKKYIASNVILERAGRKHDQKGVCLYIKYFINANSQRWMKWRQASGILCDRRVPQKLKGRFYRTAIRPAMLYGAECWPTKRRHIQQLGVAEMRMLRWICGHTRKDRVRNDDIRERLGVAPIEEKLVQHRLRWFGHIQRRPPEAPVHSGRIKRAKNVKRGRGRPNLTWEESVKRDLKVWNIDKDLAMDWGAWKLAIHVPEP